MISNEERFDFAYTGLQKKIEQKADLRGSLKMDNRCENEEDFKEVLDFIQNHIETEIPYAEVVFQEDTYHEDIDELIRFLLFSRGENEYFLSYGYDGYIYSYSKSIPKILLLDIHNAICFALKSEFIIPLQLKATRNYDEER